MRAQINKVGMPARWVVTLSEDNDKQKTACAVSQEFETFEDCLVVIKIADFAKPQVFGRPTEYEPIGFKA